MTTDVDFTRLLRTYISIPFFPRTIMQWNSLSSDIVSVDSVDVFKSK